MNFLKENFEKGGETGLRAFDRRGGGRFWDVAVDDVVRLRVPMTGGTFSKVLLDVDMFVVEENNIGTPLFM